MDEITVERYLELKKQGISDLEMLSIFHYSSNSIMSLYHWKKKNGLINKVSKRDMPKKSDVLEENLDEVKRMRHADYRKEEIAAAFGVKLGTYEQWVRKKVAEGRLTYLPRGGRRKKLKEIPLYSDDISIMSASATRISRKRANAWAYRGTGL